MSLLGASGLSFRYHSGDPLFEDATFSIGPADRVAIVGANGSGKSTLLRIMAGELEPVEGTLVRRRRLAVTLGEQQVQPDPAITLFAFAAAATDQEHEVHRLLGSLGFSEKQFSLPLERLSGGQRTRAGLARALLSPSDLLLLDEPTNHLDMAAREWLESELERRRGACALVSHDRALLRAFATRVIEIERGKVRVFESGYDAYRERRALLERQAWADYEAGQRRRQAAEQAAQKRAALAAKVAVTPQGVRHSKDFYGRKAAKVARTARILRERPDWEGSAGKPWEESGIGDLRFDDVPRASDVVFEARGLGKDFGGHELFSGLDFYLRRGERLAILGPNGSGKTTLLDILDGSRAPSGGEVRRGVNVTAARFTQDTLDLDPARSTLAHCGTDTRARTLLACLKLSTGRWNSPVRDLSAGERTKVALVRLLLSGANLLLLDEPTNHLEIEAQEALEQALARYPGALVVVSHDRAFLAALGPELRVVELGARCKDPLDRAHDAG